MCSVKDHTPRMDSCVQYVHPWVVRGRLPSIHGEPPWGGLPSSHGEPPWGGGFPPAMGSHLGGDSIQPWGATMGGGGFHPSMGSHHGGASIQPWGATMGGGFHPAMGRVSVCTFVWGDLWSWAMCGMSWLMLMLMLQMHSCSDAMNEER